MIVIKKKRLVKDEPKPQLMGWVILQQSSCDSKGVYTESYVGNRILLSREAAVKFAVKTILLPSITTDVTPKIGSAIKQAFMDDKYQEALDMWSAHMQSVALQNPYVNRLSISIIQLPIMEE